MNSDKIDMYLVANGKFFPGEKMPLIKEKLRLLPDEQFGILHTLQLKDPTNMLLFSFFLGHLGVDRFMLGDTVLGILKLITLGGCLVWWFIDLFLVRDNTKEANYNKFMEILYRVNLGSPSGNHSQSL